MVLQSRCVRTFGVHVKNNLCVRTDLIHVVLFFYTLQSLWNLVAETSGPLVQRVSKTIMAVKCKPSPKHPLGYLHFAFLTSRVKDRVEHRHFCSCPEFKVCIYIILVSLSCFSFMLFIISL